MVRRSYDTAEINSLLDQMLAEVGPDYMSGMKLLAVEKHMRSSDHRGMLPGKTVLRAAINAYRTARWPACAPKRVSDRFSY